MGVTGREHEAKRDGKLWPVCKLKEKINKNKVKNQ